MVFAVLWKARYAPDVSCDSLPSNRAYAGLCQLLVVGIYQPSCRVLALNFAAVPFPQRLPIEIVRSRFRCCIRSFRPIVNWRRAGAASRRVAARPVPRQSPMDWQEFSPMRSCFLVRALGRHFCMRYASRQMVLHRRLPVWLICRRRWRRGRLWRTKNGPGNRGHWAKVLTCARVRTILSSGTVAPAQRPKCGRSPLRMAIRLLAVSRRSMEAIRRPNRVLEGRRPIDAVLDMVCPLFLDAEPFRFVIWGQFMYTRCQLQQTCLHSSNCSVALQQN
jgi:hypothetical protein